MCRRACPDRHSSRYIAFCWCWSWPCRGQKRFRGRGGEGELRETHGSVGCHAAHRRLDRAPADRLQWACSGRAPVMVPPCWASTRCPRSQPVPGVSAGMGPPHRAHVTPPALILAAHSRRSRRQAWVCLSSGVTPHGQLGVWLRRGPRGGVARSSCGTHETGRSSRCRPSARGSPSSWSASCRHRTCGTALWRTPSSVPSCRHTAGKTPPKGRTTSSHPGSACGPATVVSQGGSTVRLESRLLVWRRPPLPVEGGGSNHRA